MSRFKVLVLSKMAYFKNLTLSAIPHLQNIQCPDKLCSKAYILLNALQPSLYSRGIFPSYFN